MKSLLGAGRAGMVPVLLAALLVACGGGGGGGEPTPTNGSGGTGTSGGGTAGNPPRIEPYESVQLLSFKADASRTASGPQVSPSAVTLPPLDAGSAAAAKSHNANASAATARQVGQARPVAAAADAAATARLLRWQRTPKGELAAATSFRSEGAASVRLGLLVDRLPPQAVVRVMSPAGQDLSEATGEQIHALLARNPDTDADARTYWFPSVGGQDVVLEIALPPGADPAQVKVAVPRLSHLWVDLTRGEDSFLKIGESSTCNIDASCEASYLDESRAVARVEFVSEGSAFLCTGTLMADVAASGTPWFLSARHCISDQSSAATVVTYWFYRSSTCNSGVLGPQSVRLGGGATLLYEAAATDTAFLRLERNPPAGVLFAGSLLAAPAAGTSVIGLHHPVGDLLKFSLGSILGYANCTENSSGSVGCGQAGDNFASVRWSRGTTQRGSSGSAIFTPLGSNAYVTAHLYAGLASCLRPDEPDYYGRFDIPYRSALHQYLGDVPGAR
ncbi:trypsin-like serine peptidase [Ramlibacter rhizophilus]|uniref:Endoproteinase ArgC n=1 Tax=Ramlibacter rhizophilus TaxID=1781167 RepID=A0A4Z0BMC2_9BURK|nr:endoproteinase ArgC [Ramlibacter rhizophilus]TFY99549.1 endoproteinase ArgC [Ramlibacter rhizophilus]